MNLNYFKLLVNYNRIKRKTEKKSIETEVSFLFGIFKFWNPF